MKQIDGRMGGGQVLRLAISLAVIDDIPIRVNNVRGGRVTPGLRAQHVAAIEAVASVTNGTHEGVEVGSETVTFEPGEVIGGEGSVDVGTAGSISLIFDTLLPLGVVADDAITLHASGGTDVNWAPPIDYLRAVKLPVLERFGPEASIENVSRGFYPKGGGSATLQLESGSLDPIECISRGDLDSISIQSIATSDLSEADVTTRQVEGVRQSLESEVDVPITEHVEVVDAPSTGTSVLVVARYEQTRAGFSALGEPGRPAEEVGEGAARSFLAFQNGSGAVEAHLADQLLPFLGLAGGTITTPEQTAHVRSAVKLLSEFGHEIEVAERGGSIRISARPHPPNRN